MCDSINNNLNIDETTSKELVKLFLGLEEYAIILINDKGFIESWSKGATALFQYEAHEIVSKPFDYLQGHVNGEIDFSKKLLKTAKEQGKFLSETYLQGKNSKVFFAHITVNFLNHSDGNFKSFVTIIRDITEQKTLEEQNQLLQDNLEEKVAQRTKELAIVNKELEAFSYSVSHDLRTPLRAISGFSDILKEDYEHLLGAEGVRVLNNIINNAQMMGRLIDDLLSFSKMSRLEMVNESVDMEQLINTSMREVMYGKNEKQYSINIKNIAHCKGDPGMLKQVWTNLIDNAVKYSCKKTTPIIEIGAIDEKTDNVYYVKDNGTGFDMKYSEKLFGVFQRLHRQDEFEGTGLGLALVKRIISKHGGDIWAKASLNEGATFFFRLPKSKYE